MNSALLIEDEPHLTEALRIALRKLGIPARHASTIQAAREELKKKAPGLILLDRGLPDGDGLQLCEELRKGGFQGCILVLTASGSTEDRVHGLNHGADDYLPKPFSWEELDARIRALLRRHPLSSHWALDEARLKIHGPRGWVELTPLEFKLASMLIRSEGRILTRDELLKDVWGFTLLPKTRTVDHFLGRLRKHFEEDPEQPRHFLTVRGAGYRFEQA